MRRGCLFLDPENHLATGRRSEVYRAPLVASLCSSSSTSSAGPQRVSVVAKLARGDCRSHHLLRQEGRAYARMPAALQGTGDAALPQFYGLYVPVDAQGRRMCGEHPDCDGYLNADCAVEWPSPILLMEDCGVPIEVAGMDQAQRAECWSLVTRLHDANVAHGSARASNILVQPATPSAPSRYRLISLGRAEVLSARNGPPTRLAINSFEKTRERDMQTGLMELRPLQWADVGVTCSGEQ
ncbi:hypothetical protein C2E23DRAFT_740262 [Lenzites betulinus]|nr:hypothetical protein C2E23DRAFT_740262 [Lenzites betulinus]